MNTTADEERTALLLTLADALGMTRAGAPSFTIDTVVDAVLARHVVRRRMG